MNLITRRTLSLVSPARVAAAFTRIASVCPVVCRTGAVVLTLVSSGWAQGTLPPPVRTVDLAGPRVGITSLAPGIIDHLGARGIDVRPVVTQFGWQFEKQFFTKESGLTAVTEWVALAGGLEQGVVLPSVSWLVGLRTQEGAEFGMGPNISPAGVALAVAAGITVQAGAFNVPLNVAVVPSRIGMRLSVLTGFTMRRRR